MRILVCFSYKLEQSDPCKRKIYSVTFYVKKDVISVLEQKVIPFFNASTVCGGDP